MLETQSMNKPSTSIQADLGDSDSPELHSESEGFKSVSASPGKRNLRGE